MNTGFDATTWRYGPLATLFHELDKPTGTSFGDFEFHADRLRNVSGPVLEPAVGTGRILMPLLERGLAVRGYDTSAAMPAQCRVNCARRGLKADVFESDMTTHREPGAYEAELRIFSLLWFGLAEFTAMLHRAGFTDVTVHGGYRAGIAPTAADDVWTFEATRT
ncbi:class I SAM-dependent methyltransferase [Streptomyces sp. CLV115]|uniref:class I SAM-dependent methyltransferase n=1 Tax=Streptomyces sp. CLV115 TaxID=3138502 RepID=UPI00313B7888